jgi:hypothetical protein
LIDLENGGTAMSIKVIYKDKNIGIVSASRLDELIRLNKVAAYCRPNGDWVGVGHDLKIAEDGCHEQEGQPSIHVSVFPEHTGSKEALLRVPFK